MYSTLSFASHCLSLSDTDHVPRAPCVTRHLADVSVLWLSREWGGKLRTLSSNPGSISYKGWQKKSTSPHHCKFIVYYRKKRGLGGGSRKGVGVMRDKELKLEEFEPSHTWEGWECARTEMGALSMLRMIHAEQNRTTKRKLKKMFWRCTFKFENLLSFLC
jgi:hypothetical protein